MRYLPQHFLYFNALPQGQGSFRPIFVGAAGAYLLPRASLRNAISDWTTAISWASFPFRLRRPRLRGLGSIFRFSSKKAQAGDSPWGCQLCSF